MPDRPTKPSGNPAPFPRGMTAAPQAAFAPPTDIIETPDRYEIRLELAGVSPSQIEAHVAADGRTVTVAGVRRAEPPQGEVRILNLEIEYGPFARIIHLPQPVDGAAVQARSRDGVLTLSLPKLPPGARRRSVPIRRPGDD